MVEGKFHQLHDTVGSSCVMFGSAQLSMQLERSAHSSVYSSNSEVIDDSASFHNSAVPADMGIPQQFGPD